MVRKARRYGLQPTFSRTGFFKPMASKSYWSYGQVKRKDGALTPEGRILIDTAKSFVYVESGLKGVLMASRLSGLSPNLTSRFTPGTLIFKGLGWYKSFTYPQVNYKLTLFEIGSIRIIKHR